MMTILSFTIRRNLIRIARENRIHAARIHSLWDPSCNIIMATTITLIYCKPVRLSHQLKSFRDFQASIIMNLTGEAHGISVLLNTEPALEIPFAETALWKVPNNAMTETHGAV